MPCPLGYHSLVALVSMNRVVLYSNGRLFVVDILRVGSMIQTHKVREVYHESAAT